jgi:hypothetical protein
MIRTATQADAAAATSVLLLAFGGEAFDHGGAHLAEGGAALWLPARIRASRTGTCRSSVSTRRGRAAGSARP